MPLWLWICSAMKRSNIQWVRNALFAIVAMAFEHQPKRLGRNDMTHSSIGKIQPLELFLLTRDRRRILYYLLRSTYLLCNGMLWTNLALIRHRKTRSESPGMNKQDQDNKIPLVTALSFCRDNDQVSSEVRKRRRPSCCRWIYSNESIGHSLFFCQIMKLTVSHGLIQSKDDDWLASYDSLSNGTSNLHFYFLMVLCFSAATTVLLESTSNPFRSRTLRIYFSAVLSRPVDTSPLCKISPKSSRSSKVDGIQNGS